MIVTGLVFLMLAAAAVSPAQSQGIQVNGDSVTLTCSGQGTVKWYHGKEKELKSSEENYEVKATQGIVKGEYRCDYEQDGSPPGHLFYLNVKVCENCYELSNFMAMAVIFGDLLITGAIILIVYMCVPKNTGSTQQKASKPRSQSAPPVPNPDYERLNQRTRTTDVYSALK